MRFLSLLLSCFISTISFGQDVAIGEWLDHFPYHKAIMVEVGGNEVFCASQYALFSYDISSGEMTRLSKTNSLSDVGISSMKYDAARQQLLVGYSNGNLDVIIDGKGINLPFIKINSSIIGNKSVNSIRVDGDFAYLSCGFGIVVLDLDKLEVKETYIIGNNSSYVYVTATAVFQDSIYASTSEGLYAADKDEPFLVDFNNWSKRSDLPAGIVNDSLLNVFEFDGKLHVKFADYPENELYVLDGTWSQITSMNGKRIRGVFPTANRLYVCHRDSVEAYDGSYVSQEVFYEPFDFDPYTCMFVNNILYSASNNRGLVYHTGPTSWFSVHPSGPESIGSFDLYSSAGHVWNCAGNVAGTGWNRTFTQPGISSYIDNEWKRYSYSTVPEFFDDTLFDILSVAIDPNDPEHVFAGSHSQTGLLEFQSGAYIGSYDESNSSLQVRNDIAGTVGIPDMAFDSDGNLWLVNMYVNEKLSVRTEAGSWRSYNVGMNGTNPTLTTKLAIDESGQKWILAPGTGITVFNDNGTITDDSDDQTKLLTTSLGNGNLPSSQLLSIAVDLDGEVWIGTSAGPAVFYSPESVFSGNNFDAQQILIEQDGNFQLLLETEEITAIAVDGGNRKWLGTSSNGVFLMSEDGTTQIHHFTEDNSPLLSNEIQSIAINGESGEVFFGTQKGLISYRGTATDPDSRFNDVLVFPNPVKETYYGDIAIKGLARDSDVKITDVSGRVVYFTKSTGGTAIWNGNNFSGERAQTGVYFVFATDANGDFGEVAKILFVN